MLWEVENMYQWIYISTLSWAPKYIKSTTQDHVSGVWRHVRTTHTFVVCSGIGLERGCGSQLKMVSATSNIYLIWWNYEISDELCTPLVLCCALSTRWNLRILCPTDGTLRIGICHVKIMARHGTCSIPWQYTVNRFTHLHLDKMAAISQTTVSVAFYWMKISTFRFNLHWQLFLRVRLTINPHWFR